MNSDYQRPEYTTQGGNMRTTLTSPTAPRPCASHFFRRLPGYLLAAVVAMSGCASKPAHEYNWRATADIDHIPTDGLIAAPQVVTSNKPVALINLGNDVATRRWNARQRAINGGIAGGAAGGAVRTGITMLPLCVIPPLCIVGMAVGAAMGGAIEGATAGQKYRPTWVTPEEAAAFSTIFSERATSASLQKRILSMCPKAAGQEEYPRLVVRVEAVELLMDSNGVATFVLKGQAQAFPAPGVQWKPTEHEVRFPARRPNVWLASNGEFLRSTLDTALDTLSASIVSVYLPEANRMSSGQVGSSSIASGSTESEISDRPAY